MLPILVGKDVAAVLGAESTLVRTGEYFPNSEYECLVCRKSGDFRNEPAAAMALLGPDEIVLALIHAVCGSSSAFPIGELAARFGRDDDPEPGRRRPPVPDTTFVSVVQLDSRLYPMLTITPGDNIRVIAPGSTDQRDSAVEAMRAEGFAAVDLGGARFPVELPRWSVHIARGRLAEIRKPGGVWWTSSTPPALPVEWQDAARATRQCLVLIIASTMPEGDLAALRAAMSAAAAADGLVGALLPVRGTWS